MSRLMIAAGLFLASLPAAHAEEQIRALATAGNWVAIRHSPSMTAAADMCAMANIHDRFVLRQDVETLELRVNDPSWSLPAGVEGTIVVKVGQNQPMTFPVFDNTDNMVAAKLNDTEGTALLTAMDKASALTVTVGKAKPWTVSLTGSGKVATAFKTCAGINAAGQSSPSSNPFK